MWTSNKLKTEKGGLLLIYIKPACCKNILHKRHGQLGFHFLILFLKYGKELKSLIFCSIKTQIFGDKKDLGSESYLTLFGFLVYNSLSILKSYSIVSLALKTSPNIGWDRPCRYLLISVAKLWISFDKPWKSHPYQGVHWNMIYSQNIQPSMLSRECDWFFYRMF